jgi:hypothetical protein
VTKRQCFGISSLHTDVKQLHGSAASTGPQAATIQIPKVYIDPTAGYASYRTGLAVNGSIEGNLGQHTFPLLRAAVLAD